MKFAPSYLRLSPNKSAYAKHLVFALTYTLFCSHRTFFLDEILAAAALLAAACILLAAACILLAAVGV